MREVVVICGVVAASATLYAWVLNKKRVHDWYTPDRTWVTVIGGNAIILGGFALVCSVYMLPWLLWWIAFFLNCAAGAPIIIWQQIRVAKRRRRATDVLWRE